MRQPPPANGGRPPTPPRPPPAAPALRLCARRLSAAVVLLASLSMVTALLLVHLNPRRFRIHPLPYVSDAGLYDPERVVLALGLCVSAALFLPLALAHFLRQRAALARARGKSALPLPPLLRPVPAARIARLGLLAAGALAVSLATFTAVPGWFLPHHVFAALFAVAAAAWSLSVAAFDVAVAAGRPPRPSTRWVCALGATQMAIVVVFAVIWTSVITGRPWKMIPNKDLRFVVLAVLEYIGTTAFLVVIRIVGVQLGEQHIVLSLAPKDGSRSGFRAGAEPGIV